MNSKPIIIACDHGYGNMKTAHAVFKTGVTTYDKEPTFKSNLLVYQDRYYLIGDEHKEFTAEKMNDTGKGSITVRRQQVFCSPLHYALWYQTSYYVRIICVLDLISRLSIITVQ